VKITAVSVLDRSRFFYCCRKKATLPPKSFNVHSLNHGLHPWLRY